MKRALATLLLAVFSFSLISPAVFAASADDHLPACCRRFGKHHCSSAGTQSGPSGASLKATPCASYPAAVTVMTDRIVGSAGGVPIAVSALVACPVDLPQRACAIPTPHNRTQPQRGPPVLV